MSLEDCDTAGPMHCKGGLTARQAGRLHFLARVSGRRRHVRRSSVPGQGACGSGKMEEQPDCVVDACCCSGSIGGSKSNSDSRSHGSAADDDDDAACHHPHETKDLGPATSVHATTAATNGTTRRCRIPPYLATLLIITYTLFGIADACSSRSTPKPRPPTPTPRPNITFHMYTCPPDYAEWYCLNGATCFTVKIVDSLLYNCLCASGYVGQRCEFKNLDGSYIPARQRVMLETASIAGGATIAVFLVVIICIAAYIHCKHKQKELRTSSNSADSVDGPGRDPELRPFSNRSLMIFMAKNHNNSVISPSIEQTRMPGWNYAQPESTRMASISEGKHTPQ